MRTLLCTTLALAGCASGTTTTRPAAEPPDPRTITDTTETACAGASGDGQCMVLQVAGMDTLLVPESAEVEQVPGTTEVRIMLEGGASAGAAIAWRADGRNLLLAAIGRPARLAIVAPKRFLVARRSWLAGESSEAMAVGSTGLAEGWTQLGMAGTSGAQITPQSPDAAGAAEVPASGDAAAAGVPQQGTSAGSAPEDVTTGQTTMGDEQTEGTTPPVTGVPTPAPPAGGAPPPSPY